MRSSYSVDIVLAVVRQYPKNGRPNAAALGKSCSLLSKGILAEWGAGAGGVGQTWAAALGWQGTLGARLVDRGKFWVWPIWGFQHQYVSYRKKRGVGTYACWGGGGGGVASTSMF